MQFTLSLAAAVAVLQFVAADVVYVTRLHTTTVEYGYQAPAPSSAAAPVEKALTVASEATEAATTGATTEATTPTPTTLTTATSPSSTASSGSGGSGIYADIAKSPKLDAKFAKAILDAHNKDRAQHQAGDLSWDKTVYEYAQAYADQYDCSGGLTHSGGKYGENLAVGYADGPAAVQAWYSEGDNWNYGSSSSYNHFTQVVWKDTTKLGCAIKDCSANNWGHYVICSYDPAGNMIGDMQKNVLP
ncbi:SCP domain-containing protein [[Candida] zeylanoides]